MRVRIKLFAQLRDRAATGDVACELPAVDAATVADVWDALIVMHPALTPFQSSVSSAVNAEYAKRQTRVHDGDEVAFLPPVSGG